MLLQEEVAELHAVCADSLDGVVGVAALAQHREAAGQHCAAAALYLRHALDIRAMGGPSRSKSASRSSRRALLMPQVNPGSRYRCGKRI